MIWRSTRAAALGLAVAATASACSYSVTAPMPAYAPVNNAELAGEVEVRPFTYPAEATIGPRVINNTAAGTITINQTVGEVVTYAVTRELRQAGISTKPGGKCWLRGVVNDLTVDDLGFSVIFTNEIRFQLFSRDGAALLDKTYSRKMDGTKGEIMPALMTINAMIGENVGDLLANPDFIGALARDCGVI